VLSAVPPGLAETFHFPAGPIVAVSLLALIAARALSNSSSAEQTAAT
jgi:hypothetical protein